MFTFIREGRLQLWWPQAAVALRQLCERKDLQEGFLCTSVIPLLGTHCSVAMPCPYSLKGLGSETVQQCHLVDIAWTAQADPFLGQEPKGC